jgi:hypothetical protein
VPMVDLWRSEENALRSVVRLQADPKDMGDIGTQRDRAILNERRPCQFLFVRMGRMETFPFLQESRRAT